MRAGRSVGNASARQRPGRINGRGDVCPEQVVNGLSPTRSSTTNEKPVNRSYHVFTISDKDGEMLNVRLRDK